MTQRWSPPAQPGPYTDGDAVEQRGSAIEMASRVASREKVLARMDVTERRLPQDGQFVTREDPIEVDDMVNMKAAATSYREVFRRRKLGSRWRGGSENVLAGIATVDEVLRFTT